MKSKDLFSHHADEYAMYRPSYPSEIFRYLSMLTQQHVCAWDAATGNGQAALMLTPYFDRVIATDISRRQIDHALSHEKIIYHVASIEHSNIQTNSIDLTTVAQAFHWLDKDAFVDELTRVSKKGAVLAIWCYGLLAVNQSIDAIIHHLYHDILGDYWEPERKMVEDDYVTVKLPFSKIIAPSFPMTAKWDFPHLMGYLKTWSAYKKFLSENKSDPLDILSASLQKAWRNAPKRSINWLLKPKIWRL